MKEPKTIQSFWAHHRPLLTVLEESHNFHSSNEEESACDKKSSSHTNTHTELTEKSNLLRRSQKRPQGTAHTRAAIAHRLHQSRHQSALPVSADLQHIDWYTKGGSLTRGHALYRIHLRFVMLEECVIVQQKISMHCLRSQFHTFGNAFSTTCTDALARNHDFVKWWTFPGKSWFPTSQAQTCRHWFVTSTNYFKGHVFQQSFQTWRTACAAQHQRSCYVRCNARWGHIGGGTTGDHKRPVLLDDTLHSRENVNEGSCMLQSGLIPASCMLVCIGSREELFCLRACLLGRPLFG